jgi:hypothetical protein
LGNPGLVEPARPHGARVVADLDAHDAQAPAAKRPGGVAEDLDGDRAFLAGLEAGEGDDGPVAVAVREAQEEIANRLHPCLGRGFRGLRTNSLQDLQRNVEHTRSRPVDRGVAQLSRGQFGSAREGAHY